MSDPVFVRALWGDHHVKRRYKVMEEVKRLASDRCRGCQSEPCVYYVCGQENADFLRQHGFAARLLTVDPVVNWRSIPGDRNPQSMGRQNWGDGHWRHKLEILWIIMEMHPEIVWLDWNAILYGDNPCLPDDFWPMLRKGKPFQMVLRDYVHAQSAWRRRGKGGPNDQEYTDKAKTKSIWTKWFYCRDREIIRELLDIYNCFPHWTDEDAVTWWLEKELGHWDMDAVKRYKEEGYWPNAFYGKGVTFTPDPIIFHLHKSRKDKEKMHQ